MANLQTSIVSGSLTVTAGGSFGTRPTVGGTGILLSGEGGAGGTPGGSDGMVQYNNGGVFGGASIFKYDDANNRVGINLNGSSPSRVLHTSGQLRFGGTPTATGIATGGYTGIFTGYLALDPYGDAFQVFTPLVQTVYGERTTLFTTTSLIPLDDTIPQNTEGVEVMAINITPKSASNFLYITSQGFLSSSLNTVSVTTSIIKSGQANAIAAQENRVTTANTCQAFHMTSRISAASTDNQGFALRMGGSAAGTVSAGGTTAARRYGGVGVTTLVVEERTQ